MGINQEHEYEQAFVPSQAALEDSATPSAAELLLTAEDGSGDLALNKPAAPEKNGVDREQLKNDMIDDILKANTLWYGYYRHINDISRASRPYEHSSRMLSFGGLERSMNDFDETVRRLCFIKEKLLAFGETSEGKTPDGTNVGETMEPLLVPWEFFATNQASSEGIAPPLAQLREHVSGRGNKVRKHYLDYPFFMSYDRKTRGHYEHTPNKKPQDYPAIMSKKVGWWGIMLAQLGKDSGVVAFEDKEPAELTHTYLKRGITTHDIKLDYSPAAVADIPVDGMGVYEWTALTLQNPAANASLGALLLGSQCITKEAYGERKIVDGSIVGTQWEGSIVSARWDDRQKRYAIELHSITERPKDLPYRLAVEPARVEVPEDYVLPGSAPSAVYPDLYDALTQRVDNCIIIR